METARFADEFTLFHFTDLTISGWSVLSPPI